MRKETFFKTCEKVENQFLKAGWGVRNKKLVNDAIDDLRDAFVRLKKKQKGE